MMIYNKHCMIYWDKDLLQSGRSRHEVLRDFRIILYSVLKGLQFWRSYVTSGLFCTLYLKGYIFRDPTWHQGYPLLCT